jgi:hypothetical protein
MATKRLPLAGRRIVKAADVTPGAVVRRAYIAANRGRFSEANRYLAPKLVRGTTDPIPSVLSLFDEATAIDARARAKLREAFMLMRPLFKANFCWKVVTRGRTLASVEVARELVRGDRATVHVTLRLKNGDVHTDTERLVRTSGGWLIGDPKHR